MPSRVRSRRDGQDLVGLGTQEALGNRPVSSSMHIAHRLEGKNMIRTTRRDFVKSAVAGGLGLGIPSLAFGKTAEAEVRIAVVGLGGIKIPGSVGGRGRQLIQALRQVPGARIVALCDVDRVVLDHGVQLFKDRNENVTAYTDIRKLLDDKAIDAVMIALPNHWHGLAAVWACQAGKDVYVEKPLAHSIWEGRQVVAAARKYSRIVQVGTQSRSSPLLSQAIEYLRSGQIGPIRWARAIVYNPRDGIGKVNGPTPVPPTIDYDLWCGPAPKTPLRRSSCTTTGTGSGPMAMGRWATMACT